MQQVCCIINCDCFHAKVPNEKGHLEKRYLVRELAYIKIKRGAPYEPRSYLFDLGKYKWEDISKDDRSTIQHQTSNIHGHQFYATPEEKAVPISDLPSIVEKIHAQCNVPGVAEKVAFKGGHIEKDILAKLKIPMVNLQSYGCPKFKELNTPPSRYTFTCGHHKNTRFTHCARAEVAAFSDWLKDGLEKNVFPEDEDDDDDDDDDY